MVFGSGGERQIEVILFKASFGSFLLKLPLVPGVWFLSQLPPFVPLTQQARNRNSNSGTNTKERLTCFGNLKQITFSKPVEK